MADRVVAVIRHRGAVLCRRETGEGPALGLPARPLADGDPDDGLQALLSDLGIEGGAVERRARADGAVAYLRSVDSPGAAPDDTGAGRTWQPPSTLRRAAAPADWVAYRAVAPTVETVAGDTERGSTAIGIDALWALRDAATVAAAADAGRSAVEPVAARLLEARPAMAALENRVNRVMWVADTPSEIEEAASRGIERAYDADDAAAALAAETVDGVRVLTLSRSGTVRAALLEGRPPVEVLASRPGGEGLVVADALATAGLSVTTYPDAAVYDRLASGEIGAVLVGADAVTPDGGVVNKVGTRAAALAAERAAVPCYAVCASDKIRAGPGDGDPEPPFEPLLDLTPSRLVTAVLTERGRLTPADVADVADEHRQWRRWT